MTITEGSQSEVARLRAQIEREHQCAAFAASGLAITAPHWFITRRMARIGACQEQLASLVGEQASMAIVCDIFEGDPSQGSQRTGGTS